MSDMIWASNEEAKKPKADASAENSTVELVGNHIYFYNGVDFDSALKLNKMMQEQSDKILNNARINGIERPILNIHINSGGGLIHAGTAIMDTICRLKKDIDIHTYVEGRSGSAATFISCVGTKRFITENSVMLIHQLSAGMWGKYSEMIDDKKNMDLLMVMIRNVYNEYTKVPKDQLDKILERDLYWDAKKCLKMGLVDEIV